MTQNVEEPSQIVPLLVAAVICDAAVEDPSTKKKTLVGIFDRILVRKFPTQRPLSLYMKIADALGRYAMQVKVVNASTGQPLMDIDGDLVVRDKLRSTEFLVPIPAMPVPTEGRYEFQVWFNGMYVGQTFLDVESLPS